MANRMESVRLERRGSLGDIEGKAKRKWELLEKEAEGGRKEEEEGVFKKSNKITRSPDGGKEGGGYERNVERDGEGDERRANGGETRDKGDGEGAKRSAEERNKQDEGGNEKKGRGGR